MLNKKAEGYIFPCVMIVILCMIFSLLIFFVCTISMIRTTKENAEMVFDSYVTENAIDIYNSIKQGNDYTEAIDNAEYVEELSKICTFVRRGRFLYNYDSDGAVKFYITQPVITFVREHSLKIQVSYTMYVPIRFNGVRVQTAVIPVVIKSNFMEKY